MSPEHDLTTSTARLRTGPRGAEVWRSGTGAGSMPGIKHGTVTAHVLDPDADLDVVHAWVTRPGGDFWGLDGLDRDALRETYAFVDSLPTHHAYLLRWDGDPIALVQLYHPEDDPVAAAYDVRPGDVGVHFFKGADGPAAAHGVTVWSVLGPAALEFALAEPGASRLVVEPDARHRAAIARMVALGFEEAGTVSFDSAYGPKVAMLAFCERARAEAIVAASR